MNRSRSLLFAFSAMAVLLVAPVWGQNPPKPAPPPSPAAGKPAAQPASAPRGLSTALIYKPWKGDFDAMVQRRLIRVLVPYGRTLHFNDKGQEKGITADLVRDFERNNNTKYRKDKRPITVVIIPTTGDKLLSKVEQGLGDIVAGNITVTEARLKPVDFVAPDKQRPVRELIVTGPKAPAITSMDDLAGKTVKVRPSTSYHESILALNKAAPVRLIELRTYRLHRMSIRAARP
jgi:ABC-type amino acid transport substrate-binding protein